MSVRAEIADAASELDDINVTAHYRQTTKPGDGWVALQRSDRDDTGLGFMDRWGVTIVVPQDVESAQDWIDDHLEPLQQHLSSCLIVTAFIPTTIRMDSGELNGLVVEGVRGR